MEISTHFLAESAEKSVTFKECARNYYLHTGRKVSASLIRYYVLKFGIKHSHFLGKNPQTEWKRVARGWNVKGKRLSAYTNKMLKKYKFGKTCAKCGKVELLEVDHIIPYHISGDNRLRNLQVLCGCCHNKKTLTERH